ncbi:BTB/POZ domain-containing protein DOT3 [Hibiscus syriacus]|uniref:BTB/POZ domain-containing protein DOT3 n=1 Tax=Hibiscus syriacus TaxID=106335 RepID=A0A6A3BFE2_HIBSY|nr:BTB/POZ domain-containing protein DOT3 [Hibiscus syriacus]
MKKSLQMHQPQSPARSDTDGTGHQTYYQSIEVCLDSNPTDLAIQVQDVIFNVHKYPLVSKCGYIGQMELQPSISKFGRDIKLEKFPAGPDTFEIILKFCYGCLISKTESFLTFVVMASRKDTITVLRSCETLSPRAENLQIMLKTAKVNSASPVLISDLEKRIGLMLEDANVNDLLIPNYKDEDQGIMINSLEQRTMHNIDVVQRILDYFLMH